MENVDEEAEARLVQEMSRERGHDDDIIVLDNGSQASGGATHSPPTSTSNLKDRYVYRWKYCCCFSRIRQVLFKSNMIPYSGKGH